MWLAEGEQDWILLTVSAVIAIGSAILLVFAQAAISRRYEKGTAKHSLATGAVAGMAALIIAFLWSPPFSLYYSKPSGVVIRDADGKVTVNGVIASCGEDWVVSGACGFTGLGRPNMNLLFNLQNLSIEMPSGHLGGKNGFACVYSRNNVDQEASANIVYLEDNEVQAIALCAKRGLIKSFVDRSLGR